MIIEIKGVQFVNKGAELMLHAILQQIEKRWPEAKIALDPNANSPYVERARLGAYQKLSIRKSVIDLNAFSNWLPSKIRKYFKESWGIVSEADVDVVLDASGFAYGDQWSSLKIKHLAGEIERSKKFGKKYIFMPQALGPFTRKQDIILLKESLPKAELIFSREKSSFENVESLIGNTNNLFMFPDFTNLVEGTVPDYYSDGERKILVIPNSNMVSERNQHNQWRDRYVHVLCDAVNAIKSIGCEPVLLNHEGAGDYSLCEEVKLRLGVELEIISEPDPLAVKGIIGASKAIICSRFHGCVSALAQGVPCLGTSWSHKYERLFEEYERQPFLLRPDVSATELSQLLSDCIQSADDDVYQGKIIHFKKLSSEMWDLIDEAVNR